VLEDTGKAKKIRIRRLEDVLKIGFYNKARVSMPQNEVKSTQAKRSERKTTITVFSEKRAQSVHNVDIEVPLERDALIEYICYYASRKKAVTDF